MNVFEDLIVELKQENLLERTVIDDQRMASAGEEMALEDTVVPNRDNDLSAVQVEGFETYANDPDVGKVELDGYDAHLEETVAPEMKAPESQIHKKPRNGQEFYRKRAMAEVSNLQMVEHVLTGVEREYMKVKPRIFDDFEAKKALNTFLQVTENENSTEHKEAEFRLMSETESWCSALSERDHGISVQNLRQYCENSRPALSSQALVALSRFYRNLPYSEQVRSKFDFVITRLFSRSVENELRVAMFSREESLGHIQTLYRDWSSIALYGADDDESKVSLAALSFDDLATEAEAAGGFDQLIENDFFGRVRNFKEGIGDLFYAPNVLAAAIEANVRIGNAYVKLIDLERRKMDAESLHLKYGDKHDGSVSDGIGRTLDMVDLLRSPMHHEHREEPPFGYEQPAEEADVQKVAPTKPVSVENKKPMPVIVQKIIDGFLSMNRGLAAVSIILVALSVGIYVYANFVVAEKVQSTGVREVTITDPLYKDYVTTGRVSDQTFYGMLLPTWDGLTREKKQEIVTKIYQDGKEKGYTQVNLVAEDGKSAAFASATRLDIMK